MLMWVFAWFFGTTAFALLEGRVLYLLYPPGHGQDAGTLDTVPIRRVTTDLHMFSFKSASLASSTRAGKEDGD